MSSATRKKQKALAKSLFKKNHFVKAGEIYAELCREESDAECHYMLSVIYGYLSNFSLGEQHATQAIKLNPVYDQAWNQLGISQAAQNKYELAINSFNESIKYNPRNVQAINNLGNLYRELGNFAAAEACYKKSLELDRKNYITINNIANIYLAQCRYVKAESYYKSAIKINKDYFDAYYNLGATYQSMGNHKKALNYYKQAQKIRPDDINPKAAIANSYEKQGKYDKALEVINPLLIRNIITPDTADIYSKICIKNKKYDDGIEVINKCLMQQLSPIHEQALRFSLGDLYDKKGEYDKAFKEYFYANTLRPYQYDTLNTEQAFNNVKETFLEIGDQLNPAAYNSSVIPIFIVGMPRSATSLIEQILSSHSDVCGAGELPYLGELAEQAYPENKNIRYPNCMNQMTVKKMNQLADSYMTKLKKHGSKNCHFISDKMPHNFLYVGLIHKLFPNCKIIHCLRNPLDVCLSIYFHNFNQNHPYSDDLKSLGHYYNQYRQLMTFWHQQYPDLIIDVSYEDLLTNPEENVKKLLQHIGLDWQDECLKFYENKRTVSTPSYAQVTQPLYKSSMERWRNYSAHIAELKNTIDNKYIIPLH